MQFFMPALTLVFVAAKLFGAIDWIWLLVLSPILIQWLFIIACLALIGAASRK